MKLASWRKLLTTQKEREKVAVKDTGIFRSHGNGCLIQDSLARSINECLQQLLLQGVGFANKVHQFAGGFDTKIINAFEELKKVFEFSNALLAFRFWGFRMLN